MTATLDYDIERFPLGLIHSPVPPEVADAACFLAPKPPNPPAAVVAPYVACPMADNDRLGCCTVSGACHSNEAGAAIAKEPWTYEGDEATQETYFGLSGGQDTGLQLPQVLVPWHATGFWGQGRNGGYVSVHPKDTINVKRGIWIMGNVYIAVNLPMPAQPQFRSDGSGVWELTHTDQDYQIEGGHCVVPIGYSAQGPIAATWGSTVQITWEWWFMYVSQVYAVVPPAFVKRGSDDRGFNLAAIDTYLPRLAA